VVTETRSYTHPYDNRTFYSTNGGSWSVLGGSVETLLSTVTADYPLWDYKAKIARGENCTTDMSGSQTGFRRSPLTGSIHEVLKPLSITPAMEGYGDIENRFYQLTSGRQTNVSTQRLRGNIWRSNLTVVNSDTALLSQVTNQALMGFNAKVLKRQTEWNSFVTAGELGEALRGMVHPLKSLRKAADDLYFDLIKTRRGWRRTDKVDAIKVAAETWLEFSFGVKPTVADIQDAARACARLSIVQTIRDFVSYTAYGKNTVAVNDNVTSTGGYTTIRRRKQVRNNYVGVKFYGAIGNTPLDAGAENMLNVLGISWHEVVPTVWELIPYSFLIDYFTNCGEIISSFSHGNGGTRWVSKGTCFVSESSWNDIEISYGNPSNVYRDALRSQLGERCFKVSRTITRGIYTGTRLPSFEWQMPGFGLRWLNIAALSAARNETESFVNNSGSFAKRPRSYRR
jgi:hypothetical protein